jgi:hypothetical protein
MLSTNLAGKTLLLVFAIPLVSQMDINFESVAVRKVIAQKMHSASGAQDVDMEQLKQAVDTLGLSADMNMQVHGQLGLNEARQGDMQDEQFRALMNNLNSMTSKGALE